MANKQAAADAIKPRSIKVSDSDWESWGRAAALDGRNISSWLKHLANTAAKKALKK